MRVVICDDDEVLVSVMRSTVFAKHDVVLDTSRALEAVEAVAQHDADLLVLDLALGIGTGKDAIDQLRASGSRCAVVVFTAFAGERASLIAAGAAAVIEKPDFSALEAVVDEIDGRRAPKRGRKAAKATKAPAPASERRRVTLGRGQLAPPHTESPSGIEPNTLFDDAVTRMEPGDTVMAVALDGIEQEERSWGPIVALDYRLAVARALRAGLRTHDHVTVEDDATIVVLLLAGEPDAAERVFMRVMEAWRAAEGPGRIVGGYATRAEGEQPPVTRARAHGALVDCRAHGAERLLRG